MKITPHFSLDEFSQPARHGFTSAPYPSQWIDERLRPLCNILEMIREQLRGPLIVTSGFRSEEYNRKIGGARNSQHVQGRAADFTVPGVHAAEVHRIVLDLHNRGLIKLGGLGNYRTFTHVDVRPGRLVRWTGSRL